MPATLDPEDTSPGAVPVGAVLEQLGALRADVKDLGTGLHEVQTTVQVALSRRETDASEVERMRGDVDKLKTDMATVKVKSGIWGALAGAVAAVGLGLMVLLK